MSTVEMPRGEPLVGARLNRERALALGRDRVAELDGLRGLAVLLVISKHYGIQLPGNGESGLTEFINRFYGSFSGADFFIVLMGFLLGGSLLDAISSRNYYRTFFIRRALRTCPLYYVTLFAFAVWLLGQRVQASNVTWPFDTPWAMLAYATYMQNVWMAYEGSLGPYWLQVTWSLAVIEQFYVLLPWLLRHVSRSTLPYVLAGLFVWAPLCRLIVPILLPSINQHFFNCLPVCRTDTLCIGVLAALLIRKPSFRLWLTAHQPSLCPLAILLFGGFACLTYYDNGLGNRLRFLICPCYLAVFYLILVLIGVFSSQSNTCVVLRSGVLRALGQISYGMFLFHQGVNFLVHDVSFGTLPKITDWQSLLASTISFFITAVLAFIAWHFIEKPLIVFSRSFRY